MSTVPTENAMRKKELREDFEHCDTNRDGRIDYKEFCTLMLNLESGMAGSELRIGFHEIDTNHDDLIDFGEFRAWWTDR
jgi:Ca2+-binding EF-hand superfamily protein